MTGLSPLGAANPFIARLITVVTLVCFLSAQPAVMCIPLCLSQSHHQPLSISHHLGQPCHSADAVRSDTPVAQSVSVMLPSSWSPALPAFRVVPVAVTSPDNSYLRSLPPQDPPPPRLG